MNNPDSGSESHLQRKPRPRHHCVPVPRAGVRGSCREVSTSVAPRRQNCFMRAEAVDGTVLHVQRDHAPAGAVLIHDQVQGEELDEKLGVVAERLAVQGVQQSVPGSVGSAGTPGKMGTG
jgi:hypothetical protein